MCKTGCVALIIKKHAQEELILIIIHKHKTEFDSDKARMHRIGSDSSSYSRAQDRILSLIISYLHIV